MLSGIEIQEAIVRHEEYLEGQAKIDKGIGPETGLVLEDCPQGGYGEKRDFQREFELRPRVLIEPFDKKQVNPNSYNVRLAPSLIVYDVAYSPDGNEMSRVLCTDHLDMKKKNPTHEVRIPEEGLVLEPGMLYLGRTIEYTESHNVVPQLNGRSSTGRLGLHVHATAGFGDVGFCGTWTLEMSVIHPLRVYAGVEVAQIAYFGISIRHEPYKSKKYQGQRGVRSSRMHKEL
jgi:dCTP deaminase